MGFLVKFLSRKWLTSIVAGLILPLLGGLLPKLGETLLMLWPYLVGGYLLLALWIVLEWRADMAKVAPKDPETLASRIIKLRESLSGNVDPDVIDQILLLYTRFSLTRGLYEERPAKG